MANSDPRQAIIERLFPASGRQSRGGFGAKRETLVFLKARTSGRRMVQAISFETVSGRRMQMICYLLQNVRGEWQFSGAAGGEGEQGGPVRNHPSVRLGGGGWPDYFFAGGTVIEQGYSIVQVRLIAGNGTVMEDNVEDGLVVFVSEEQVTLPIRAELYDHTGNLVGNHSVLSV
ncbi:MAG TPA: hypothetical protein VGN34_11295 [Ktedonobacteraceae bacterium]|jgi:hypothetical protein